MAFDTVFAVVPVADFDAARAWFERLWGRPADRNPMEGLAEWQVTEGGAMQLLRDAGRSGAAMLTVGVDDVDGYVAVLAQRGLDAGAVEDTPGGFRIAALTDPAGNVITLVQDVDRTSELPASCG
ncbi:VOC family protein [Streptomyces sp. HO565]|uniref:VOC family protein n=1 Tax=Streptomyces sp. HO565 TaxID=2857489 RepID=UPI0034DCA97A